MLWNKYFPSLEVIPALSGPHHFGGHEPSLVDKRRSSDGKNASEAWNAAVKGILLVGGALAPFPATVENNQLSQSPSYRGADAVLGMEKWPEYTWRPSYWNFQ